MGEALLIKSQQLKGGEVGKWNKMDNAPSYIQGIKTGDILKDVSADTLGTLISGVPTPWARAKLFKFAFDTLIDEDPNIEKEGMFQYYKILHAEWKGLLAVMALYSDRIRISDPITMNVNDDDYSITAAFGRMLFDEKDLWCNQDELAMNKDAQPFIQLIYYRDRLVGGTSPLTGCFTGVDYSQIPEEDIRDIPWYRNGHFDDPDDYLMPEEVQKVYLFVANLQNNLVIKNHGKDNFEIKVNSQRLETERIELSGFKTLIGNWKKDLKNKNKDIYEKGPVAQYPKMAGPFALLFNFELPVYMKPGARFTYTDDGKCMRIKDIQDLLSTGEYVLGWFEDNDCLSKLADTAPVSFLTCRDSMNDRTCYFTLPLSEIGLVTFLNDLPTIMGDTADSGAHLSAEYNADANQIAVSLSVEIDGQKVTLPKREYKIHEMNNNLGSVILWPDFYSEDWNRYYLYSGFTTKARENFIPIFRDNTGSDKIIRNRRKEFWTFPATDDADKPVDGVQLVTYPEDSGTGMPKYNIYRFNKPIIGLMTQVKDKDGRLVGSGFLIMDKNKVKPVDSQRGDAVVGIDFGSNNTCVYYKGTQMTGAEPVKFLNYRAVLIGKEQNDPKAIAADDELLFFSNYESPDGQLKSWLHEHPGNYVTYTSHQEIGGGIPVNRPNVKVKKMDADSIETQAGKLHYNMKWLNDDEGLTKKRAYIQSVWLQTCAYLFKEKHLQPKTIYWSYPGAMMPSEVNELESNFNSCNGIMPVMNGKNRIQVNFNEDEPDPKRITEAVAVCRYALSNTDLGLHNKNMFLGIDVGGSTSDIHLIAKDPANGGAASLFMESSVRMAAGVFYSTVVNSEDFRKALLFFHESQKSIYVAEIKNIVDEPEKAPYYLNSIFDQLKTPEEYTNFYQCIKDNAKVVFTMPAYVTGLLLFYSGLLIGKVLRDHNLHDINSVNVLTFGKGGRIFHWLPVVNENVTKKYYSDCLNAGVQQVIVKNLEVRYSKEIAHDNKAEVAKGLCNMRVIPKKFEDSHSDICGEDGISYTEKSGAVRELHPTDELTADMFENIDNFNFNDLRCFRKFFSIFIDFVRNSNLYKSDDLRSDLDELSGKVGTFLSNDNEYKHAKKQPDAFAYHQPLLIAEGLCFFEKTLIKKVFD